jgi:sterol desaturase/sphingolipid hydroxylase (fatty acid hydroxylase superfamily)
MFDSDFFDFFSRCRPVIVVALYLPGVLAALFQSLVRFRVSPGTTSCLFGLGFAIWTVTEYWLHRLVFHWQSPTAWGKRLHFLVHGVHHRWPRDKYRLLMPPAASAPLYFAFLGLSLVLFGHFGWAFHAGFVTGYVFYDLTHYWLHHGLPRSAYGRRLRRNHMLHHFKDSSSRFGVSNLIWDRIFGTTGEGESRRSEARSRAALGGERDRTDHPAPEPD